MANSEYAVGDLGFAAAADTVIATIAGPFFERRGLTAAGAPRADDRRIAATRLDAARKTPRGGRSRVVVYVYGAAVDLAKLDHAMSAAESEHGAALDELIVVAADAFLAKRQLVDAVNARARDADAARKARDDSDPGDSHGVAAFYSVLSFYPFVCVIPDCLCVPPHRLMSKAEVDHGLFVFTGDGVRTYLKPDALALIDDDDPSVIWLGARPGDIVEITRMSQTSMESLYYRRVTRRPR